MSRALVSVAAVGICFAVSIGARAQSAEQQFTLGATVDAHCTLNAATGTTRGIEINSSTMKPTGSVTGTASSVTVTCNKASEVTLSTAHHGLLQNGATKGSAGGFDNFINYTASINGGAGAVTLDTAAAGTTSSVSYANGAIANEARTITITPAVGNPLLPGSYSDTLTVTIAPAT